MGDSTALPELIVILVVSSSLEDWCNQALTVLLNEEAPAHSRAGAE